jgi:serine phosphatase RsbU (regulator of sigma subunit)
MATSRALSRISLTVSILSWLALVFTDLTLLFSRSNEVTTGITDEIPLVMRGVYFVSLFFYFKYRIEKAESLNFVDLLWRVFVTGLLTTIGSLSLKSVDLIIGKLAENIFVVNLFYLINLGLAASFVISTLIVCKRLILYQKSKLLMRGWVIFEYGLFISLLFDFLPDAIYNQVYTIALSILILLGVILSVNMKWVAYLNFKQKWKSILLIILTLLYLGYFYVNVTSFEGNQAILRFHHNTIFLNAIYVFIFIYALFSTLVILFNLPTSSVFEQKLGEVVNYQRLSQSIQTEKSEDKVYEILLDSSVSAVFADAGWIEVTADTLKGDKGNENSDYSPYRRDLVYYKFQIEEDSIWDIKSTLQKNKVVGVFDFDSTDRTINYSQALSSIKLTNYRSIISLPIQVQNQTKGALILLKDVGDGFNREMAEITKTFVNQAGISIENFRLLTSALQNERYQEELKIAKRVQDSLLPDVLDSNDDYEILAFSESADEVGGDYYDTYKINDSRTALMIGDVSGKGTSAAFNMSQMKGVFHSLSQMDLDPLRFFVYANKTLSTCLEKTSFITASYFIIDSDKRTVDFARAGHCPTLIYDNKEGKANFYESKGLGLGILRDDNFENYLEKTTISYKSGDVILLYTDGITEAKNFKREEYGYDRLKEILEANRDLTLSELREMIIKNLYEFSGEQNLDDDYTIVLVKFK